MTTALLQPSRRAGAPDSSAIRNCLHAQDRIRCAVAGGPAAIRQRLEQLENEWDLDRLLAAAAGGGVLTGLVMGTVGSRAWRLLALMSGAALLQHATTGTCLPGELLRKIGVRTVAEIEDERSQLNAHLRSVGGAATHVRDDISALHPTGKLGVNDFVETAAGHIKPATQG